MQYFAVKSNTRSSNVAVSSKELQADAILVLPQGKKINRCSCLKSQSYRTKSESMNMKIMGILTRISMITAMRIKFPLMQNMSIKYKTTDI